MNVRLRPAADPDLPAVGDLHYRSRASAYAGLVSPAALTFGSPAALGEWWAERWKWERDTHRLTVAVTAQAGPSQTGTPRPGDPLSGAPSDEPRLAGAPSHEPEPGGRPGGESSHGPGLGGAPGERLVGFTYLGPGEDDGVAELSAIHADPAFVGTGVGRAMMLDALPALARIAPRAVLWVLEGNARARRFYERGGWTADGVTRMDTLGNEPVRHLRYARAVSPTDS
ncbi:GNAT family N-acetyltransferase [Pseudosporangium ferrugineum]|uniref:Acetyltransferase (GNAT) family protein n=1 Tax=Pseudosporangium ferrugineum TaxID=439699 RepID=A0A2T0S3R1_9ACTN|nr:GNAT family N-acetyltransferase [Pseudosporangium ferrugineum]PRY28037.1 acetyltransferase (GNAT) family protein [Pseudosporangium ferrugineum]